MTIRVAFLRAVNVGRRTAPMAKVADVCRSLGYDDVWTHANSGNAVFEATGSRESIEHDVAAALQTALGFEVTAFVRSRAELVKAMAVQPFDLDAGDTYFITFLHAAPSAAGTQLLEASSNDFDTIVVLGRDVHWRMRGKSTDTTVKPAIWKRAVGDLASTSRNTNLLGKLIAKIDTKHHGGGRTRPLDA